MDSDKVEEGDEVFSNRSSSLCQDYVISNEYFEGDKIIYEGEPYVAVRYVYPWTPPQEGNDWFWVSIAPSECGDGTDPDPDRDAFIDRLTVDGRQIAEDFVAPEFSPDAQALADEFIDAFEAKMDAGEYEPHLDSSSDPINSIRGGASVSSSGSLSYTVPLPVVPGRQRLTPRLALNYGPNNQDRGLGVGWSLDLPPVIHVCEGFQTSPARATPDMEGALVTVAEAKTRVCYGGMPLVPVEGSADELGLHEVLATDGGVYRTVPDSGVKIVRKKNILDSVFSGFIVYPGDGTTVEYEKNDVSENVSESWWSPNLILGPHADSGGTKRHSMRYTWRAGSRQPDSISYLNDRRRVEFEYNEGRAVGRRIRGLGGPERVVDSLDAIKIYSEGELVWIYNIEYRDPQVSSGRTVLRAVRACAAGGACMPELIFEYADVDSVPPPERTSIAAVGSDGRFVRESRSKLVLEDVSSTVKRGRNRGESIENAKLNVRDITVVDLNGDAIDDVVWRDGSEFKFALGDNGGDDDGLSFSWEDVQTVEFPENVNVDSDSYNISTIAARGGHGGRDVVLHRDSPRTSEDGRIIRFGLPAVDGFHGGHVTGRSFQIAKFLDVNGDGLEDLVGCFNFRTSDGRDDYWVVIPATRTANGSVEHDRDDVISDGVPCSEFIGKPTKVVRGQLPLSSKERESRRAAGEWTPLGELDDPFPWTVSNPRAHVLVVDTGRVSDSGFKEVAYTNGAIVVSAGASGENVGGDGEFDVRMFEDRLGYFGPLEAGSDQDLGVIAGDFNGDGVGDRFFENDGAAYVSYRLHPIDAMASVDPELSGYVDPTEVQSLSGVSSEQMLPSVSGYHLAFDFDEDGITDVLRPEIGGCDTSTGLSGWAWQRFSSNELGEPGVDEIYLGVAPLGGVDFLANFRVRPSWPEDAACTDHSGVLNADNWDFDWTCDSVGGTRPVPTGGPAFAWCEFNASEIGTPEDVKLFCNGCLNDTFSVPLEAPIDNTSTFDHDDGVERFFPGDFDGDGRRDLLRVNIDDGERFLDVLTRVTPNDGEFAQPKLDALVRVVDGRGMETRISYRPMTSALVHPANDIYPDAWTSGDPLNPDNRCVGDLGECRVSSMPSRASVVSEIEQMDPDGRVAPLISRYGYSERYVDRLTGKNLGVRWRTRDVRQGTQWVKFEATEYANLNLSDVPSGGSADNFVWRSNGFPFVGKVARATSVSADNYLNGSSSQVKVSVTQTQNTWVVRDSVEPSGLHFIAPYHVRRSGQDVRSSEFYVDGTTAQSPGVEAWRSMASNAAPAGAWSTTELCDVPWSAPSIGGEPVIVEQGMYLGSDIEIDKFGNTKCTRTQDSTGLSTTTYREYVQNGFAINAWRVSLPASVRRVREKLVSVPTTAPAEMSELDSHVKFDYCFDGNVCGNDDGGVGFCDYRSGQPRCVTELRPNGEQFHRTANVYGANGEKLAQQMTNEAGEVSWHFMDWDADGLYLTESRNDLGHWTSYGYDQRFARVALEVSMTGSRTLWGYDVWGRDVYERIEWGDGDGVTESFVDFDVSYDASGTAIGHVVTDSAPGNEWVQTNFDRRGLATWSTTQKLFGQRTTYHQYDAYGRLSATSLPQIGGPGVLPTFEPWNETDFGPSGRLLERRDANGRVTSYTRELGPHHVKSEVDDHGVISTTFSDHSGRTISSIDGELNERCYAYGATGQLAATWVVPIDGDRSSDLHCAGTTALPGYRRIRYDEMGRIESSYDPELGPERFEYEGREQRRFYRNATGGVVSDITRYDSLDRVSSVETPDGTLEYLWDVQMPGYLASIDGPHSSRLYVHDNDGRLRHEELTHNNQVGGAPYAYSYEFDPNDNGKMSALVFPKAGSLDVRPRAVYHYDSWGHARSVTNTDQTMTYYRIADADRFGVPSREVFGASPFGTPNGQSERRRNFDYLNMQVAIESENRYPYFRKLQDEQVLFDERGLVVDRYDHVWAQHESFMYDESDRLRLVETRSVHSSPYESVSVDYDRRGNVTHKSTVGEFSYGQEVHGDVVRPWMLQSAGDQLYAYDARGNQIQRGSSTTVDYDLRNRPVRIVSPSTTLDFEYDLRGQRLSRFSSADGSLRRYAGGLYESEKVGGSGFGITKHHYRIPVAGKTVAEVTISVDAFGGSNVIFNFGKSDFLGSTSAVTHWRTDQYQLFSYDSWGKKREAYAWNSSVEPPDQSNWTTGFTGFHPDLEDAGLIDMGARLYDPNIGRFASPDPMVAYPHSPQGWSRYKYGMNAPLNFVDPNGMEECEYPESLIGWDPNKPVCVGAEGGSPPPRGMWNGVGGGVSPENGGNGPQRGYYKFTVPEGDEPSAYSDFQEVSYDSVGSLDRIGEVPSYLSGLAAMGESLNRGNEYTGTAFGDKRVLGSDEIAAEAENILKDAAVDASTAGLLKGLKLLRAANKLRKATKGAEKTRRQALREQKRAAGIPTSQQPSNSWTVHDPSRVKGPGVRDANPRNQGRIYEYEIPASGGGSRKVYIADHHRDGLHGGIGHVHQGVPKPGATSVAPGGRYSERGELIPYDRR